MRKKYAMKLHVLLISIAYMPADGAGVCASACERKRKTKAEKQS
jgi:hypothetical protein